MWASFVIKHEKFLRCHTVLFHLLVIYMYIWGHSVYDLSVLQCLIAVSFLSDNHPL
jgi:diacylglycerol kinase